MLDIEAFGVRIEDERPAIRMRDIRTARSRIPKGLARSTGLTTGAPAANTLKAGASMPEEANSSNQTRLGASHDTAAPHNIGALTLATATIR
jgi:hypothetical protein